MRVRSPLSVVAAMLVVVSSDSRAQSSSLSFVRLPKLDVVGSSPIAHSVKRLNKQLLNWPAGFGRPF